VWWEEHCKRLVDLINQKRAGKTIAHKPRPRGENVLDLMDALKRSISAETRREKRAGLRLDRKKCSCPSAGKNRRSKSPKKRRSQIRVRFSR
jgi:DNA end-binding protein Ku